MFCVTDGHKVAPQIFKGSCPAWHAVHAQRACHRHCAQYVYVRQHRQQQQCHQWSHQHKEQRWDGASLTQGAYEVPKNGAPYGQAQVFVGSAVRPRGAGGGRQQLLHQFWRWRCWKECHTDKFWLRGTDPGHCDCTAVGLMCLCFDPRGLLPFTHVAYYVLLAIEFLTALLCYPARIVWF